MVILLMVITINMVAPSNVLGMNSMFSDGEMLFMDLINNSMSSLFFKMVSMISIFIFIWSLFYMSKHKGTFFFFSLLLFVISMLILTLSNSMFMVFIGWEGLGITSFVLIIFYQNWMSAKGGLLTLLTNRLGDAILLITLCVLLSTEGGELNKAKGVFLALVLLVVSLTKSAQWPFISWLPAAMAAPTPVSSLVHSSTLVTAGVWLMIRFGINLGLNTTLWGILGLLTLMVASLAALTETDAKKIVALSTLSQLGLMFTAMALGLMSICYFHILMHALAKANLFMVVGGLLHSSFSQQDFRFISSSTLSTFMTLSMGISLISLVGLTFSAGFFSKEQIIMGQSSLLNSEMAFLLMVSITGLTMAYCVKLMMSILTMNYQSLFQPVGMSMTQMSPIFLMSSLSMLSGFLLSLNSDPYPFTMGSSEKVYWSLMLTGVLFLSFVTLCIKISYQGFYTQLKMIDLQISSLKMLKPVSVSLESSVSEMLFLFSSFVTLNMLKQSIRFVLMLSLLSLLLIMF